MKIICDTNIWYHLGANPELFEKVKDEPICPTNANIYELSKTANVVSLEHEVRAAIQKMFHFKQNVIYKSPFVHLASLSTDIEFDVQAEVGTYLQFTELFASGEKIREDKIDEFKKYSDTRKDALQQFCDFINGVIDKRRSEIPNKQEHKSKDMVPSTFALLNFMVKVVTERKYNIESLDLSQAELLVRTLGKFLHNLERSTTKIKPNDWYDILQLAYVQPGDKYWTKEKKWLSLIQEAGMEGYLYDKG